MSTQIPFGLRGNRLLETQEVESGLACDCICPKCGGPLIARKGAHNVHHFAHYQKSDCEGALETALHLKAKAILFSRKKIVVPPVYVHHQQKALSTARLFQFEKAQIESYFSGIVSDIVLIKGNKKLIVEITVTHETDTIKIRKIRKHNIPTIEIDALKIYNYALAQKIPFNTQYFSSEMIHGLMFKNWLYNPKKERIEYALRKKASQKKVKHRLCKGYHLYLVNDCPLKKRTSSFGGYFANVFQDCLHCSKCLEIQYARAWVGFKNTTQLPKHVLCWGKLKDPEVSPIWSPL
jgi:hypothetical protein